MKRLAFISTFSAAAAVIALPLSSCVELRGQAELRGELLCHGTESLAETNEGQSSGPTEIRILLTNDPRATTYGSTPICAPSRTQQKWCKVAVKKALLHIDAYDQGVGTSLDLDRKTGAIYLSRGGLDGGWGFKGTCTQAAGETMHR